MTKQIPLLKLADSVHMLPNQKLCLLWSREDENEMYDCRIGWETFVQNEIICLVFPINS